MFLIKDSWELCHKHLMTMIKDVEGFFPYHHHLLSVSLLAIIYDYHAFCRGLLHKNAEKEGAKCIYS